MVVVVAAAVAAAVVVVVVAVAVVVVVVDVRASILLVQRILPVQFCAKAEQPCVV